MLLDKEEEQQLVSRALTVVEAPRGDATNTAQELDREKKMLLLLFEIRDTSTRSMLFAEPRPRAPGRKPTITDTCTDKNKSSTLCKKFDVERVSSKSGKSPLGANLKSTLTEWRRALLFDRVNSEHAAKVQHRHRDDFFYGTH